MNIFSLNSIKNPVFIDIDVNSRKSFVKGVALWALLFFGYMFFASNWFLFSKLEGDSSKGWAKDFTVSSYSTTLKEATGFAVLFARGISTIFAGYIISKLTHRYSVLLSLLFTTCAFPLIFSPFYWMVIIGRIIMALGGTLIIIYIQPVISKFFDAKNKGFFGGINGLAYVCGVLLVRVIFLSETISTMLVQNWKITASFFALLTYLPFFGYLFVGSNFKVSSDTVKEDNLSIYKKQIKSADTWFWIFCYSFLIVVSVLISDFFPRKIVSKIFPIVSTSLGSNVSWDALFTIVFYIGTAFGVYSIGIFNKMKTQRTTIVTASCVIALVCWFCILFTCILCTQMSNCPWYANVFMFLCTFIFAFFGLGLQAVLLYIPHEYPNHTPQSLSVFYSLLWGCAYIIFTLYYIFITLIFDISFLKAQTTTIISIFMILYVYFSLKIKEPKLNWPVFPWQKIKEVETTTNLKTEVKNIKK